MKNKTLPAMSFKAKILSPKFKLEPFNENFLTHQVKVIRNTLIVLGSTQDQFFLVFKNLLTSSFKKVVLKHITFPTPDLSFLPAKDCVILSNTHNLGDICGFTLDGVLLFRHFSPKFLPSRTFAVASQLTIVFKKEKNIILSTYDDINLMTDNWAETNVPTRQFALG